MDLAGNAMNAIVISAVGVMLWLAIRGRLISLDQRIERIEGRMDRLDERMDRLDERIERLEERFQARFDRFEERLDGLRGDLTQVALAVGASPRADSG